MKRFKRWVALGALSAGALAFAGGSGRQKLYVQAATAKLQSVAGPKGATVETLGRGTEVTWLGADSVKSWHKVQHGAKSGVMFQAVLSPHAPGKELVMKNDGTTHAATAEDLASSGAATKAISDGAVTYGKETHHEDAVRQILMAEAIEAQTTPGMMLEHAKKAQLPTTEVKK